MGQGRGEMKPSGSGSPEAYMLGQAPWSHGSCCQLWGNKPVDSRSSGAWLLAWDSRSTVQWHCCHHRRNQSCRQWEPWGLLAGSGFQEHRLVVLLLALGNPACWLALSVTHRAVGAMVPAYTGPLVSLAFQGE
jgi:hypothetical protein